ncbi:MAG: ankyrin repeat domain-containing protein [Endomicrobia bacterium]|nr:ankyrin repeat domain-containing protein [Endomicrobiia bacterium]
MKKIGIMFILPALVLCFYSLDIFAANNDIFKFIQKNDVKSLKKTANSQTVSLKDEEANSPLLYAAAEARNPEIITILLEAGANIEEANKYGCTPLMLALKKNYANPDIAMALIKNKANANAVFRKKYDDEDKMTPLLFAVSENSLNSPRVIQALVDAGANADIKREEDGSTPLLLAARYAGNPEIINILVKAGSNIEEKNKYGYTPLMLAVRKNNSNPQIAVALILNKAGVNAAFDKKYDDEDKMTSLMYAVSEYMLNKPKVIQALIDAGADINVKNAKDERTPLLIAAGNANNTEIIDILVKAGSNIEEKDKYGYTPLMLALKNNYAHPDIAIALIKYKADVNAALPENSSAPLLISLGESIETKPKVIQALIDYGADVNAKNIEGITPLMYAAKYSSEEVIKILLKAGADMDIKDKNGKKADDYVWDNLKIYQKDLRRFKK